MKKIRVENLQWHTLVIVLLLLLLSLLSWPRSAKKMGTRAVSLITGRQQEASADPEQDGADLPAGQGTSSGPLAAADSFIDSMDSQWSVWEKSTLSKTDSLITYYGLGEFSSVQVLAGSDKWLFYKTRSDGDPIADYEGTNSYTVQETESMAASALRVQRALEERGTRFALLVPPNKENVYPQYMPGTYVHAPRSRTDLLVSLLAERGVNALSPLEALSESPSQAYYYYDTHWNQLGAYIGTRQVLASWGLEIPALSDRQIVSAPLDGNYHYSALDDLAQMAGLRSVFRDEIDYRVEGTAEMDWAAFQAEYKAGQTSHFHNDGAVRGESLLLVGDSFRSAMVPLLREQFADVYVVHRSHYSSALLDEVRPDYLIAEYVERYSAQIMDIGSIID